MTAACRHANVPPDSCAQFHSHLAVDPRPAPSLSPPQAPRFSATLVGGAVHWAGRRAQSKSAGGGSHHGEPVGTGRPTRSAASGVRTPPSPLSISVTGADGATHAAHGDLALPACSSLRACADCVAVENCAWCGSEQACLRIEEVFEQDCRATVFEAPCPLSWDSTESNLGHAREGIPGVDFPDAAAESPSRQPSAAHGNLHADEGDEDAVGDAEELELAEEEEEEDEPSLFAPETDGAGVGLAQVFELSVSVHGKGRRMFKLPASVRTAHAGIGDTEAIAASAKLFCEESLADIPAAGRKRSSSAEVAKLLACERDLVGLVQARLQTKRGRGEGKRQTVNRATGDHDAHPAEDAALQALPALQRCAQIRLGGQVDGSPQSGRMGSYTRLSQTAHGAPVFMLDHRTDTFLHFFEVSALRLLHFELCFRSPALLYPFADRMRPIVSGGSAPHQGALLVGSASVWAMTRPSCHAQAGSCGLWMDGCQLHRFDDAALHTRAAAAAILIARILTLWCLPVLTVDRNKVCGSGGRSQRTASTHVRGRSQRTGSRQQQCPFVDD